MTTPALCRFMGALTALVLALVLLFGGTLSSAPERLALGVYSTLNHRSFMRKLWLSDAMYYALPNTLQNARLGLVLHDLLLWKIRHEI